MKKINPHVDTFHGINNALNPCSPQYRQGMAWDALNSRLDESGIWNKAAALTSPSMGDTTVSGIPTSVSCLAHWKFNETSGTTADNSYGESALDGTASSASIWSTEGLMDGCIDCDDQYYVTIADDASLSFGDGSTDSAFSLCAWIYMHDDGLGISDCIIAKQNSNTSAEEWKLAYVNDKINFYLFDSDSSNRLQLRSTEVSKGQWHFISATYDGSSVLSGLSIYVDGVITTSTDSSAGSYVAMHPTSADVTMGMYTDTIGSPTWYLDGKIDSAMIFNKELSANEVFQLYNNGVGNDNIDQALNPHFSEAAIESDNYIVKNLKYNTTFNVGPNRYAYYACDNMGTGRKVYYWDGTDKSTAVTFVDNETATNYGLAGLARPTSEIYAEQNPSESYGGRQEKGRYYYTFTWYDTERQCESLPATCISYDQTSWLTSKETCKYPVIAVSPEIQLSEPTSGAGRYDDNTKVRVYRSKRTYTTSKVVNSPSELAFIGEVDYNSTVATGITYDHTGDASGERKMEGSTNDFSGVAVGDFIYVQVSDDVADVALGVYEVSGIDATNSAYVLLEEADGLVADGTGIAISFMTLADSLNDNELLDVYEGRGTPPPSNIDFLAPYNNRIYYFVKNTVYWSSAGRPGEVAQEYDLSFKIVTDDLDTERTDTVTIQPSLSTGSYGEAKYEVAELSGETVKAAYAWRNRLYLWTEENSCGYLESTYTTEGVRFHLLRRGVGIISDKTLSHTPYGLFGVDREGVWQMDNAGSFFRISKGTVDFSDSTKSTYASQSSLEHSFGFWAPKLDEYIFCIVNLGTSTYCRQVAYNPIRSVFSGIYSYPSLFGGTYFVNSLGSQNYLSNAKTLDPSSNEALAQTLKFWMGQHSMESVKGDVEVEVVYDSITSDKTVSGTIYQNNIGSETGAIETTGFNHTDENLVGRIKPTASGRMFEVSLSIPSDCVAPIITLTYIADYKVWNEKNGR